MLAITIIGALTLSICVHELSYLHIQSIADIYVIIIVDTLHGTYQMNTLNKGQKAYHYRRR
jgi:hypothetical protein